MIDALRSLQRWSPAQQGLRLVALLGPVVALLAAGVEGRSAPWWLVLLVVGSSAAFAVAPESLAGLLALGTVVAWWCFVPGDGLGVAVLLGAVALLAAHVAGLLAAYGPGESLVATHVLARWVVRGGTALLAAPFVWGVGVATRDATTPAGLWTAGLLAALLVLLVGSAALFTREAG